MGIQVFVHPAEEDIFSESVATMAQPGGQTDIFPFMTAYTRLNGRYGTCVSEANEVKQYFYTGAYATDGCLQSCYQQACENICGCMDPRYPMAENAAACSLSQRTCVDDVTTNLGDPSSWDNCTCPNACAEREYDVAWTRTVYSQRKAEIPYSPGTATL
ncbi:unnamed protein product, partial [Mesorhabditis belari]|uniref:Uncharacterized protein n=1 Tax=Mesorhabditis belari TaxID=2138241 RepID=A0AAF3FRH8_9BILA